MNSILSQQSEYERRRAALELRIALLSYLVGALGGVVVLFAVLGLISFLKWRGL